MSAHSHPEVPELALPVKIYFYDTDAGGVVHNVAYLRLIEQARSELAEHLGWPLAEMTGGRDCPVVARTEIDYLRPARLGDPLEIVGRLTGIERVRFHLEFEMRRTDDATVLVRCRQIMVPVNLATGRPQPLRPDWKEKWPHLFR
ncbi:MAG: thioesterase family protein [Candidatus Methylacidiphilales bacterium]|nr:thioesterase family protein [Candidatus Methylacidiphilales bacterium]